MYLGPTNQGFSRYEKDLKCKKSKLRFINGNYARPGIKHCVFCCENHHIVFNFYIILFFSPRACSASDPAHKS